MKFSIKNLSLLTLALLLFINPFFDGDIFSIIVLFFLFSFLFIIKFHPPKTANIHIVFLLLILITGVLKGVLNGIDRNYIRDIFLFSKSIYIIYLGLLLGAKFKIENANKLFRIIIYAGLISALYHFIEIINVPGFKTLPLQTIREYTRRASLIEVLSHALIIYCLRKKYYVLPRRYLVTFIGIISISIALFVSRTMFLCLFIYIGFLFDFFRLSFKAVAVSVIVAVASLYIFSLPAQSDQTSIGRLINKIQKAPSELFFSDEDVNDKVSINADWRGYEALMAINQTLDNGKLAIIIGNGFGALVDLKITMKLGNEYFRFVPKIHNGYAQLFFKTGLFGVLFFLIFMILFFAQVKRIRHVNYEGGIMKRIILASIIIILLTTSTIAGIYNDITLDPVLLIIFFSFSLIKRFNLEKSSYDGIQEQA